MSYDRTNLPANSESESMSTAVLNTIRQSWSWTGLRPAAVIAVNRFGNVLVRAADATFWRICPEELSCAVVARDSGEFEALWASDDFQRDWQMASMAEIAEARFGPIPDETCYCLKIPAVLGGGYDEKNLGTISRQELIASAGDVAQQIRTLPNGTTVEFVFTK